MNNTELDEMIEEIMEIARKILSDGIFDKSIFIHAPTLIMGGENHPFTEEIKRRYDMKHESNFNYFSDMISYYFTQKTKNIYESLVDSQPFESKPKGE